MKSLQEFWKDDVEFPERYEVSNLGRVRSKSYIITKSNGVKCTRKPRILYREWHPTGVWRVRLCVNTDKCSRSVHRMVAKAFLGDPEEHMQVNHKDGDRSNNEVRNLEWVTHAENMQHAVETGLINNPFGKEARNFKSAVLAIDTYGNVAHELYGNKDMMDKGFCYKQISAVLRGKQKTHKGYKFIRVEENLV